MRISMLLLLLGLFGGTARAQELRLIFETQGRPAQIFSDGFDAGPSTVFNDTIWWFMPPEGLLLSREDDDGLLTGLFTANPRTREVTWRMNSEELDALGFVNGIVTAAGPRGGPILADFNGGVFVGLLNLYGDGSRYPVFAGEGKLLVVDPQTNAPSFRVEIDGIDAGHVRSADFTGDGRHDLLLLLPYLEQQNLIQIWGDDDTLGDRQEP